MPTIAHCQKRARELTALAEHDPQHRAQHLADAAAWLFLARRMVQMSATLADIALYFERDPTLLARVASAC
jgi:hypothetical protein